MLAGYRFWFLLCCVNVGIVLWAGPAAADVISATTVLPSCTTATGTANNCTDTGYLSNTTITATSGFIDASVGGTNASLYDFQTAFNDWNAANGSQWNLVLGETLDVTLSANLGLAANAGSGGFGNVIFTISGADQALLDQLVWTQALVIDYTPTQGLLSSPLVTLDTYSFSQGSGSSGGAFTSACEALPTPGANNTAPSNIGAVTSGQAYCDPIYPFQYGSEYNGNSLDGVTLSSDFFYDGPQAPWPNGAFQAETLLSTVTYGTDASDQVTSKTLTVYQGIEYGFSLGVPEPSSAAVLASALPLLWLMRSRQRAARTS